MTSTLYVLTYIHTTEQVETLTPPPKLPWQPAVNQMPPDQSDYWKPIVRIFSSNKSRSYFIENKLGEKEKYKITNVEIESFGHNYVCI